jgi:hypothetical protein
MTAIEIPASERINGSSAFNPSQAQLGKEPEVVLSEEIKDISSSTTAKGEPVLATQTPIVDEKVQHHRDGPSERKYWKPASMRWPFISLIIIIHLVLLVLNEYYGRLALKPHPIEPGLSVGYYQYWNGETPFMPAGKKFGFICECYRRYYPCIKSCTY